MITKIKYWKYRANSRLHRGQPFDFAWPARCGALCLLLILTAVMTGLPAAAQEAVSRPVGEANAAVEAPNQAEAPAATTSPATAPASQQASQPASQPTTFPVEPGGKMLMNFRDASLRSVLEYLSAAGGLMIVEEAKVEGRVTVMSRQPVDVDEAVSLVDTVLKPKGFAALRNGKVLRIVTVEQAKKDLVPVRMGNDPAKIKPTDQIVTQVIPIRYADAVRLKADLASLIPTTADVTSNASSNTLIITSTEATVRRIVEIIQAIDVHMSEVSQVKVFQLKYANAASAARLITDIFKVEQTGGQTTVTPFGFGPGAFRRFMGAGGPGGPGGAGTTGGTDTSETSQRNMRVTASSDDRTNTLVVSAAPDLMKVIEGLVKDLDANPAEQSAVFVYKLKNAQASNVATVLNNTFGWTGTTSTGGVTGTRQQTQFSPFSGFGTSSTGSGTSRSGFSGLSGGGFGTGLSSRTTGFGSGTSRTGFGSTRTTGTGTTAGTAAMAAATSDLAGQVYIVADEDTNSLLVTTASKNFDRVKAIIADLDRPVPQVLIKVLIAEVTHSSNLDLGIEYSNINLSAAATYSNVSTKDFQFAIGGNLSAIISALAGKSTVDVLSRPYILTSDNQLASIMVGQTVPIISNSRITDTGQTINTVQYQDIGIILNVTPHINPQGVVIMDVAPEISSIATDASIPISNTTSQPIINKRAAQSHLAIRDGQTAVIGGLMEDKRNDSIEKVPFLGDIPIIGPLFFQHKVKSKSKTELLIFLTPHVAMQPAELKEMSEDEQNGLKIVPQAIEPGTFQEQMKGMQRGAVSRPAYESSEVKQYNSPDEQNANNPADQKSETGEEDMDSPPPPAEGDVGNSGGGETAPE